MFCTGAHASWRASTPNPIRLLMPKGWPPRKSDLLTWAVCVDCGGEGKDGAHVACDDGHAKNAITTTSVLARGMPRRFASVATKR